LGGAPHSKLTQQKKVLADFTSNWNDPGQQGNERTRLFYVWTKKEQIIIFERSGLLEISYEIHSLVQPMR
jgi:hypothetical protein